MASCSGKALAYGCSRSDACGLRSTRSLGDPDGTSAGRATAVRGRYAKVYPAFPETRPSAVVGRFCWHRLLRSRMLEVVEAIKIIRAAAEKVSRPRRARTGSADEGICTPAKVTSRRSTDAGRWAYLHRGRKPREVSGCRWGRPASKLFQSERHQSPARDCRSSECRLSSAASILVMGETIADW